VCVQMKEQARLGSSTHTDIHARMHPCAHTRTPHTHKRAHIHTHTHGCQHPRTRPQAPTCAASSLFGPDTKWCSSVASEKRRRWWGLAAVGEPSGCRGCVGHEVECGGVWGRAWRHGVGVCTRGPLRKGGVQPTSPHTNECMHTHTHRTHTCVCKRANDCRSIRLTSTESGDEPRCMALVSAASPMSVGTTCVCVVCACVCVCVVQEPQSLEQLAR